MEFEWDPQKSQANQIKHGISFEEAVVLWEQKYIDVPEIARSEDGESRGATLGKIDQKIYVAIWTQRFEKIRIISARRASTHEQKIYNQKIQNR